VVAHFGPDDRLDLLISDIPPVAQGVVAHSGQAEVPWLLISGRMTASIC